jgi:hypothetical protein
MPPPPPLPAASAASSLLRLPGVGFGLSACNLQTFDVLAFKRSTSVCIPFRMRRSTKRVCGCYLASNTKSVLLRLSAEIGGPALRSLGVGGSLTPNPFRMRRSTKRVCNPFGMRRSKTLDLKPFRIRRSKKRRGEGVVLRRLKNQVCFLLFSVSPRAVHRTVALIAHASRAAQSVRPDESRLCRDSIGGVCAFLRPTLSTAQSPRIKAQTFPRTCSLFQSDSSRKRVSRVSFACSSTTSFCASAISPTTTKTIHNTSRGAARQALWRLGCSLYANASRSGR